MKKHIFAIHLPLVLESRESPICSGCMLHYYLLCYFTYAQVGCCTITCCAISHILRLHAALLLAVLFHICSGWMLHYYVLCYFTYAEVACCIITCCAISHMLRLHALLLAVLFHTCSGCMLHYYLLCYFTYAQVEVAFCTMPLTEQLSADCRSKWIYINYIINVSHFHKD